MEIWELDKLLLFLGFVVPGFICLKAYELLIPAAPKDSSRQIIDAIAFSCVNYALLFWPILEVEASGLDTAHPSLYKMFYAFVFFVFPIILVMLWMKIRLWNFFQKHAPHPTGKPWDYVFAQRLSYWVIATLKCGDKVAGKYAGNSFASSNPSPEQIYLEEAWILNLDGGFERARTQTAGIIILANEISTIELFHYN